MKYVYDNVCEIYMYIYIYELIVLIISTSVYKKN